MPFTADLVEADRPALAAAWPPASIPVLVNDAVEVPESSTSREHLDRHGDAPPLIPTDPEEALQARLWDRAAAATSPLRCKDHRRLTATPRRQRPHGISQPHATLDLAYVTLDRRLNGRDHHGWLTGDDFTLADSAAAAVLHPLDRDVHPALAAYVDPLLTRSSVGRVVEEARPYRELFPLPWPEHVS